MVRWHFDISRQVWEVRDQAGHPVRSVTVQELEAMTPDERRGRFLPPPVPPDLNSPAQVGSN